MSWWNPFSNTVEAIQETTGALRQANEMMGPVLGIVLSLAVAKKGGPIDVEDFLSSWTEGKDKEEYRKLLEPYLNADGKIEPR